MLECIDPLPSLPTGKKTGGIRISVPRLGIPQSWDQFLCNQSVRSAPLLTTSLLVGIVLDVQRLLDTGLGSRLALSLGGLRVGLCPGGKLCLRLLFVFWLSSQDFDAGRLHGAAEGESERPRSESVDLVDFVEVDGSVLFGDAAAQEGDTGHGRWNGALQSLDGHGRDLRRVRDGTSAVGCGSVPVDGVAGPPSWGRVAARRGGAMREHAFFHEEGRQAALAGFEADAVHAAVGRLDGTLR